MGVKLSHVKSTLDRMCIAYYETSTYENAPYTTFSSVSQR